MAKKGKKLWRKTIDTQEIQDAHEEKSRLERQGLAVDAVPDAELFYIDTEQDLSTAAAVAKGLPLRKRKREPRLLKCQAIISAANNAMPVPGAPQRKKLRGPAVKASKAHKQQLARVCHKPDARKQSDNAMDLWGDKMAAAAAQPAHKQPGPIKAVEVDAPGCSYNPDPEQHENVVAEAVAVEMSKMYKQELFPRSEKLVTHVPTPDELEALLVDAEEDEDVDNPEELALPDEEDAPIAKARPEKKTQTVRNREKRRREAEEALEAKRSLKQQRRELDSVKELQSEIAVQEASDSARAARKAVSLAEKALSRPPRLGKHRFQPANIQVLLSEEIDGSLRRLKGRAMLAKDRYKALQKRGVIEPRVPVERVKRQKKPTFQTGDRAEKVKAGHEETMDHIKRTSRSKAMSK